MHVTFVTRRSRETSERCWNSCHQNHFVLSLKRHVLRMHGAAKQETRNERYVERPSQFECDMCGLSYKTARILAKHKSTKCLMRRHALPLPTTQQHNTNECKEELLLDSSDSTQHACQFCDLILATIEEKLEHELAH